MLQEADCLTGWVTLRQLPIVTTKVVRITDIALRRPLGIGPRIAEAAIHTSERQLPAGATSGAALHQGWVFGIAAVVRKKSTTHRQVASRSVLRGPAQPLGRAGGTCHLPLDGAIAVLDAMLWQSPIAAIRSFRTFRSAAQGGEVTRASLRAFFHDCPSGEVGWAHLKDIVLASMIALGLATRRVATAVHSIAQGRARTLLCRLPNQIRAANLQFLLVAAVGFAGLRALGRSAKALRGVGSVQGAKTCRRAALSRDPLTVLTAILEQTPATLHIPRIAGYAIARVDVALLFGSASLYCFPSGTRGAAYLQGNAVTLPLTGKAWAIITLS